MENYKFLQNRIAKRWDSLTEAQKIICKNLNHQLEIFQTKKISEIANLAFASKAAIFNLINRLGFKSIYEMRTYIEEGLKVNPVSSFARSIEKTLNKMRNLSFPNLKNDVQAADIIYVIAKGGTKGIAHSFARKLKKLGYVVQESAYKDDMDLYLEKKVFAFFLSISGKMMFDVIKDYRNSLTRNWKNFLISAECPHHEVQNFLYGLAYGEPVVEFDRSEFELPSEAELITLLISNEIIRLLK